MRTLFFFLLISSNLLANKLEIIPDYFVSYQADKKPGTAGSRIRVVCDFDADYAPFRELRFGMNGSNERIKMNDKNEVEVFRKAQKAVFQFYYDSNFQEIETDSIEVKKGQITVISLNFKATNNPRPVKKPVIYLYPESDTDVSVELKTAGELTFTYPSYAKGWKGTAHPDGSIDINGTHYPYLFWESEQRFNTFDLKTGGFLLDKENMVTSLEKHLTKLGFNDKEKTDFITYWAPQLQQHKQVLIQFILNDSCNDFATLEIQPKPENLNRVYMVWRGIDGPFKIFLDPQKLKTLDRKGFDVLEWGGIELNRSAIAN
ncbi:MAG: hypothetical protein ACO1N0_12920 [Fluviicola sp.]